MRNFPAALRITRRAVVESIFARETENPLLNLVRVGVGFNRLPQLTETGGSPSYIRYNRRLSHRGVKTERDSRDSHSKHLSLFLLAAAAAAAQGAEALTPPPRFPSI